MTSEKTSLLWSNLGTAAERATNNWKYKLNYVTFGVQCIEPKGESDFLNLLGDVRCRCKGIYSMYHLICTTQRAEGKEKELLRVGLTQSGPQMDLIHSPVFHLPHATWHFRATSNAFSPKEHEESSHSFGGEARTTRGGRGGMTRPLKRIDRTPLAR